MPTGRTKSKIALAIMIVILLAFPFLPSGQIIEETGRIYPPSYSEVGNALVYNCTDKYWACVNNESYFQCRDNMNWNDTRNNRHECYTFSVYATELDCESIQQYNTSTRPKTDFCHFSQKPPLKAD